MRLTKAVFTNYKKLNNISVKLDETTVIIGQNNSGKSTLLDGINNAFSPDASLLTSRYFSKIHKEDASVKIFLRWKIGMLKKFLMYCILDVKS
jgi:putative ATP-dependent endonuclease of the OLD family